MDQADGGKAFSVPIVRRALEEPIRQNVVNAVVEVEAAQHFNTATEEYLDMVEVRIIDPIKVPCTAQRNAVSIAGLMITTECVIANKPHVSPGSVCQERAAL